MGHVGVSSNAEMRHLTPGIDFLSMAGLGNLVKTECFLEKPWNAKLRHGFRL
jgi:hypothetical protein